LQKYRLTIRATQEVAPKVLLDAMQERLAQGVPSDDSWASAVDVGPVSSRVWGAGRHSM